MATNPLRAESARANPLHSAAALMQMLTSFGRNEVEALVEASIAYLDLVDGDPDIEGECSEDDITDRMAWQLRRIFGPGCEISDAGEYCPAY